MFGSEDISIKAKSIKIENEIVASAEEKKRFEKSLRPFIEKSISAQTRRAYERMFREFFALVRSIEPVEIKPLDVFGGEIS